MANEWPNDGDSAWNDIMKTNVDIGHTLTGAHALGELSAFKTINFTRDMTAVSGSVAYTGVGFMPRQVIFFTSVTGNRAASWGIDDIVNKKVIYQQFTDSMASSLSASILILTSSVGGSDFQIAGISIMSSDGFTLNWTKFRSPTGTATIIALCLK